MDRRTFVGSAVGSAALGLSSTGVSAATATGEGRPTFAVTPDGPDSWRVRSWEQRDGAWRPGIARLLRVDGDFKLEGRIAPADRPALAEWIAAQRSA